MNISGDGYRTANPGGDRIAEATAFPEAQGPSDGVAQTARNPPKYPGVR